MHIDFFKNNNKEVLSLMKVLYVENDKNTREKFVRFIRNRVLHLTVAANGQEGLDAFNKERPDIIVTDIDMPIMDGLIMLEEIRSIDKSVPVVIVATDNKSHFLHSSKLGVEYYIKKPTDSKLLLSLLSSIANTLKQQKIQWGINEFILTLFDINSTYLAVFDEKLIYLNSSFKHFLGVENTEDFYRQNRDFVSLIRNRDKDLTDDSILVKWALEQTKDCFIQLKHLKTGEVHNLLLSVATVPSGGVLLAFTDITRIDQEKKYYQFMAEYDGLTKVYNRNKIINELKRETARSERYNMSLSALMIDVDHFKGINDTYGHLTGDSAIIELIALIGNMVRRTDILGRYGGDEFILVMPSTSGENGLIVGEQVRQSVSQHAFKEIGHITCSIGVAEYVKGETSDEFFRRMDEALYRAKNAGRNKVKN